MSVTITRLKNVKLNTKRQREQFIDDLFELVKPIKKDTEEMMALAVVVAMLSNYWKIGLFEDSAK